jgi:molybdopterin molybdotransferase
MAQKRKMMHYDESMAILESVTVKKPRAHYRYLTEAEGFVLADDIIADSNMPAFRTSGMDGYAVRHADLMGGELRIMGDNPAGSDPKESVRPGECIKTFTGSLMPEGSDTLIPIEHVTVEGNGIIIDEPVSLGYAVRPVGEAYSQGDILILRSTEIGFAEIGVMAGLNIEKPMVFDKPIVAVMSTGSELLQLGDEQTSDAQIRSTNNYTIEAIVNRYGGEALRLESPRDDHEGTLQAMADAVEQSDIVVTTGGVSVGDYDFVKDIIGELGFEVLFRGVRIKPGQHIVLARKGDKFILALPGFAYSSTVTALLYLLPLMGKFTHRDLRLPIVKATLREPFTKRAKKAEFTACNVALEDGHYVVDFESKKIGTSAILTNMLGNSALLYTTENDNNKEAGEEVDVILY